MKDKDDLIAAIDAYAETAYGSDSYGDELSTQRALALDAYAGKNLEPADEGRSQVVDQTLFETVQEILPSLTRIFAGGDDIVEFDPTGPEDEDAAKQESDYLNYIVTQKNNWFMVFLQWAQDALLTKNAYLLAYMEEKLKPEVERYEGQTPEQIALLLQDDVEIVGQEEIVDEENPIPVTDEMGQPVVDPFTGQPMMQPRITYNIEIKKVKADKKLCLKNLPPERCKVDQNTSDFTLNDCDYFEYWDETSISDLRAMGYEIDDDIEDDRHYETDEDNSRDDYLETSTTYHDATRHPDPSLRIVQARWVWMRYDFDEDGIAELQHVVRVGNTILSHDTVSTIPVACIVPFINTHRHMGMSVADLVFDIQRIKTTILRAGLDSLYLSQNPRHAISDQVHLDDMLISRPGALVRLKNGAIPGQGHVMPLPTEFVFPQAQEGLRHMDTVKEARVGVNKIFSGIDPDAMSTTNAHNAIGQLSTMAGQRVEQIARIIGNGVERLFRICHELILKSGHQEETVKLRGEWVNLDPTTWRTGRDMRVVAPYAAGNKDALAQRIMVHLSVHEKAAMNGHPMVQQDDTYELAKMLADATDIPAERIYTDPRTVQPPEPGPDYTMMALEIENKKVDQNAQDTQVDAEIDKYKADLDAQVKQYQTQANQELQIALAQLKAGQQIDVERLKANLKVAPIDVDGEQVAVSDAFAMSREANEQMAQAFTDAIAQISEAVQQANAPKKVVRDSSGKIVGTEPA